MLLYLSHYAHSAPAAHLFHQCPVLGLELLSIHVSAAGDKPLAASSWLLVSRP
jgi:hypothetical protein